MRRGGLLPTRSRAHPTGRRRAKARHKAAPGDPTTGVPHTSSAPTATRRFGCGVESAQEQAQLVPFRTEFISTAGPLRISRCRSSLRRAVRVRGPSAADGLTAVCSKRLRLTERHEMGAIAEPTVGTPEGAAHTRHAPPVRTGHIPTVAKRQRDHGRGELNTSPRRREAPRDDTSTATALDVSKRAGSWRFTLHSSLALT